MHSKFDDKNSGTNTFYCLRLPAIEGRPLFPASRDRACFIALFQDFLSPRARLNEFGQGIEIDLIAFSLADTGIQLLVRSARIEQAERLGQALLAGYIGYLSQHRRSTAIPFDSTFSCEQLNNEHEALDVSREIHLSHDDWRHDRYSSIGFYLDERRGDWIKPWHITHLYSRAPDRYIDYLSSGNTHPLPVDSLPVPFLETPIKLPVRSTAAS